MDLRALTTITALILSILQSVLSHYCYSCTSIRTQSNSTFDFPDRANAACENNRNLTEIIECQGGGCTIMNTTFKYIFDGYGDVQTTFFVRSCGYDLDRCIDNEELEPFLENYQNEINADVENGTFLGFTGYICFCTGPNCNSGNALISSPVPCIVFSVLLSLCHALVSYFEYSVR